MKVSWNWLSEYVDLPASHEQVADRLTMVGLNHESTTIEAGDPCIDFEVTSNRADCLGHLGIAREIATVFQSPLRTPEVLLQETEESTTDRVQIRIEPGAACSHYTARIIKGLKVKPSPAWLVKRLNTIGLNSVNNVVDVTNYVMMECGQPLHAFDLRAVRGREIVVRSSRAGEKFDGIDHQTYELSEGMCVIADGERVIGLAGVMGAVNSEISDDTVDVLIEAAAFSPEAVRQASRATKLRTDASHRFEKALDPQGVEWASRRCCQLLLELAGGKLLAGSAAEGSPSPPPAPIDFRLHRFARLIGIPIEMPRAIEILKSLGCEVNQTGDETLVVQSPSWRRDLTREVDLIEELARIHGYDRIPEKGQIGMSVVVRSVRQAAVDKVRATLAAYGLDEAFTCSLVPGSWEEMSLGQGNSGLRVQQPMEGVLDRGMQAAGAVDQLRRSLLPSLIEARRVNEFRGSRDAELFEIAKVYLPVADSLPREPLMLAWVMKNDFSQAKGIWESICAELNLETRVQLTSSPHPAFHAAYQATFELAGKGVGTIGTISESLAQGFHLREPVVIAEFDLDQILSGVRLDRRFQAPSAFPAISRDFNFIVSETVRWSELAECVRATSDETIESVEYRETFRAIDKDGPDTKRVLLSVVLRAQGRTLSGEEAEIASRSIVGRVAEQLGGRLLG